MPNATLAQSADSIKVHFLYGSKPKGQFKNMERKWFGGKLGGHVGIETDPDTILNFVPVGKLHVFAKQDEMHGRFVIHSLRTFPEIFGGNAGDMKTLSVVIPINVRQRRILDSLQFAYLFETPFDYAFIGMRCGSSTYYILSQLGIVKAYSHRKIYMKIFYPRRLRKRVLRKAHEQHWIMTRQEGTSRRVWEKD
jgi:hypothetical protein